MDNFEFDQWLSRVLGVQDTAQLEFKIRSIVSRVLCYPRYASYKDDLVEEVVLALLTGFRRYDPNKASSWQWVGGVVNNCARSLIRRLGPEWKPIEQHEPASPSVDEEGEREFFLLPRRIADPSELRTWPLAKWISTIPHCHDHWVTERRRELDLARDAACLELRRKVDMCLERAAVLAICDEWAYEAPDRLAVVLTFQHEGATAVELARQMGWRGKKSANVYQINRRFSQAALAESICMSLNARPLVPRGIETFSGLGEWAVARWEQEFSRCASYWSTEHSRAFEEACKESRLKQRERSDLLLWRAALYSICGGWSDHRAHDLAVVLTLEHEGAAATALCGKMAEKPGKLQKMRRRFRVALAKEVQRLKKVLRACMELS